MKAFPSGFSPWPSPTSRQTGACLRLCAGRQQQFPPTEKQIDQRASDKQPVRVLLQSSVAQLHKSELQLHHLGASKLIEMWVHSLWGKSPLLSIVFRLLISSMDAPLFRLTNGFLERSDPKSSLALVAHPATRLVTNIYTMLRPQTTAARNTCD